MQTAKCRINAGVCGFVSEVVARCDDSQTVELKVTSNCEHITALGGRLGRLDAFEELARRHESTVFVEARSPAVCCCVDCVVPCAIFKAMQSAAGLALGQAVSVEVEVVRG